MNLKALCEVIFAASIVWFKKDKNIKPSLFLTIFAYQPHWEKLLSSKRSSKAIKCIDGIRALSIMWVVLCHCWTQLTNGATNASTVREVEIRHKSYSVFDMHLFASFELCKLSYNDWFLVSNLQCNSKCR